MEPKKKKFPEIDILRVTAILLVVFGHCVYVNFEEFTKIGEFRSIGLIALNDTPMLHETFFLFTQKVCGLIYMFHVPLFFVLAGMCYALNEHTEFSLDKFIWKKFDRLIIPFFLIGSLYMIPMKYFAKFYTDIFIAEKSFISLENYGHLWFLVVLFEIFIVFRLLRQCFKNSIAPLVIISLVCYFIGIPKFYELFGGQNPAMIVHTLTYLIWFVLGYIVYREQDAVKNFLNKYNSFVPFLITAAIFLADSQYNFLPLFLKTLFGCSATYFFAICLSKTRLINWSLYATLLKYNFSIYLFHDPLNYFVINAFSRWHWIETSPTLAAISFVAMRTVIICAAAIFIAYVLEKLKIFLQSKLLVKQ